MKKELELVKEFHRKFKAPVSNKPSLISKERSKFRFDLMLEEVKEYQSDGVESGKIENVAKELADILYAVYGTILEHGLQDRMEEIFEENHRSQMSKEYGQYKMIKSKEYFEADIKKFL
jgi:predicted HAD superfamily Cof-like phosphohydrolase